MTSVNMHEAKTNLSKLVESIASGTEQEITISRNGVARREAWSRSLTRRDRRASGGWASPRGGSSLTDKASDRARCGSLPASVRGKRGSLSATSYRPLRLLLDTHVAVWAVTSDAATALARDR